MKSETLFQKSILIVGGIGAAAGVHMARQLVALAQAGGAKQDADFPEFLLYNLPTYYTDKNGFSDWEQVRDQIIGAIKKFDGFNLGAIVIACNTAHIFYDALQAETKVPIVNMVAEACYAVQKNEIGVVGVLCSTTSANAGLYQSALQKLGIVAVMPDEEEQSAISEAIEGEIAGQTARQAWDNVLKLRKIAARLKHSGAQATLIGCTELSIYASQLYAPVLDATQVAMRKALEIVK